MAKAVTKATETAAAASGQTPITIRQRRIQTGARNNERVGQIKLVHQPEPMMTRVINTEIEGRYQDVEDKGWEPVRPEEISGGLPQGSMVARDGKVVMGDGGRLQVMKMPLGVYQAIVRAREDASDRKMKSSKAMKAAAATMASQHGQDSTADSIMGSGLEVQEFEVGTDRVMLD
jgi:hypothetical protein